MKKQIKKTVLKKTIPAYYKHIKLVCPRCDQTKIYRLPIPKGNTTTKQKHVSCDTCSLTFAIKRGQEP